MSDVLKITTVPCVFRLYRLAVLTAIVSGAFSIFLVALLVFNYCVAYHPDIASPVTNPNDASYRQPATDSFNLLPTDYKTFLQLKAELAKDKNNAGLQEQVRQLDQKLRNDFFQRRSVIARTAPFLLALAIVFFVSTRTCGVLKRSLPQETTAAQQNQKNSRPYFGVLALAVLFVGLAAGLLLMPNPPIEQRLALNQKLNAAQDSQNENELQPVGANTTSETTAVSQTNAPTDPALIWSSFRNGNGIAVSDKPPLKWDAAKDENIAWKTPVPLPGKSSPVLWGAKLFLTGADEKTQHVYCFDTENGKLVWTADVSKQTGAAKVSEDTGLAAPTPATDGQRVFAMFANGELVAVDFSGKEVWRKSFGVPESSYGYAASPALYQNKVIVQYDVGDGSGAKSKIVALDCKSGKSVWETPREIPNSWSSPIVAKIGGTDQIITCGDPFAIAYNPNDGKEIWRCKCLSGDVGPSPIVSGNVVFTANQSPRSTAIDATGSGDVSKTHILWQGANALPDTPSPFAAAGLFFTLDSGGYLTAYNPEKVENKKAKYWELEIGGGEMSFYSSPLCAGNLVYVFSKTEDTPKAFVIDLSKAKTGDDGALSEECTKEMIVGVNPMSEPCVSSPAIVNNRLYIRGTQTLFCIGDTHNQ
ncbi:hypothetical protein FACS189454_07740 [Planctomycetales bacterium]|nr:hypothetical protein FACS189454_07740 [Planctomycetales bacterium]